MTPKTKTGKGMLGGSLLGHLAAVLTVAMWGYSFVSSKVLLDNGLGPVHVYFYRFVIAYRCCYSSATKDYGLPTGAMKDFFSLRSNFRFSIFYCREHRSSIYPYYQCITAHFAFAADNGSLGGIGI